MSDLFNISNEIVKLNCLKIKPGYEFHVYDKILYWKNNKQSKIDKLSFTKCFGHWDLILVHEQSDFTPSLVHLGPFAYILDTTVFHCFQYDISSKKNIPIVDKLENNIFSILVFIKINNYRDGTAVDIEKALSNIITNDVHDEDQDDIESTLLGTLGWNEHILILSSNNLDVILKKVQKLNFGLEQYNSLQKMFLKTFSNITINFNNLVNLNNYEKKSMSKILKDFEHKLPCDFYISDAYLPTINISSKPEYYHKLIDYWSSIYSNFEINIYYGDFDICVTPSEGTKWSYFLLALLVFRYKFRNMIVATHTIIKYKDNTIFSQNSGSTDINSEIVEPNDNDHSINDMNWSYDELVDAVGSDAAPTISSIFYQLNSGLQDPIIFECFKSMKNAPRAIIRNAKETKNKSHELEKTYVTYVAQSCSKMLNDAIDIRLYGTPGNLHRNYAHFGSLGGGKHRVIMAYELLPKHIFHTFNLNDFPESEWEGFVKISGSKFETFQQILTIPAEALWNPYLIWCVYHECAHMLLEYTDFLKYDEDERINNFVKTSNLFYIQNAMGLANEIIAEVVGYKLGFFNDLQLFKTLLWDYIVKILNKNPHEKHLWYYLFRTFCVELYERIYNSDIKADYNLDINILNDENDIYNLYLQHINEFLESHEIAALSTSLRDEIDFTKKSKAAMNAPRIKHMNLIFQFINEHESKRKRRENDYFGFAPNKRGKDCDNTINIIRSIENGKAYLGELHYIEGVIYRYLKSKHEKKYIGISRDIAFIITLWNASFFYDF